MTIYNVRQDFFFFILKLYFFFFFLITVAYRDKLSKMQFITELSIITLPLNAPLLMNRILFSMLLCICVVTMTFRIHIYFCAESSVITGRGRHSPAQEVWQSAEFIDC